MSSHFVFDEGGAEVAVPDKTEVFPETVQETPVADKLEAKKTHTSAARPIERPHIATVTTTPQLESNAATLSENLHDKKTVRSRVKERIMKFAMKHNHNMATSGKAAVSHGESNTGTGAENATEKVRFRTRVKEKVKKFAKSYVQNLNPKGKDGYWWAGALGKLGATVTTALLVPFAAPAVALSTASFRVGQFGAEKLNKKIHNKRLTEKGFSDWVKAREEKYPKGVSRIGRLARGTSAASIGAAIGLAV